MAVSQMQKLSLILPKDDLDSLLLALQSEAKIQIYDLSEQEEWQAAFEANTLSQPLTEDNRQALVELQKRQEQVEKMIQTLEPYMPEKKALQALKEEPLSLSFDDLQAHGMIRDEDLLLTKLKRQLRVLDKARQKIADAKAEIERLEKWRPLEVTPAALATFHYVHGLIGTIPNSDTDAVRSSLKAHPELESVEVYQERISLAKQELDLYNKQVKENGEAYNQLHADIQGIKGQLESLTKSKEKTSQETKRLSAELNQSLKAEVALTNDLEQIQLWLLEVNKQAIPKLQAQLTSYQTLKQELQTQISKNQELLQNQEKPDLAALTQEVRIRQESYDKQLSQVSVLEKGLKDATATYQVAKTLQDSNQEAFKAHQELSDLVKVVKGENTALTGRLNLEVYVIRQYFQQILDYANANYIGLLTDNRYSFVLSEEGRRARDHFGLDINVYDQLTGSERSVKSLSGGETFIAALAIALSLSEVVQNTSKGAVVEALFIDEGFGSLDKEALTKAITVLEQIGENRMVGVISHVDDMKEGIAQQLAIIKSHDGSSRIKIVDKG